MSWHHLLGNNLSILKKDEKILKELFAGMIFFFMQIFLNAENSEFDKKKIQIFKDSEFKMKLYEFKILYSIMELK